MKIDIFNTEKVNLMKKALGAYQKQNRAIAQNVANASNPDYQRTSTDFSNVLKSVSSQANLKVTNEKHISFSKFGGEGTDPAKKEGTVDITREMAELAENQIRYDFVSQVLGRRYRSIQTSITGKIR
ncbi:MAG TPA: flagellar basal body rod protein FlgB [Candidatus Marinimicrobia bacterium]|nr:flagellar basal body rod protein FlgB [Candidatus Neomarinimicrobiota bacterium]